MKIEKTTITDQEQVVAIWDMARKYMRETGIDQWQDGYPNRETLLADIQTGESYVLKEGDKVLGTCFISFRGEADYETIEEGEWTTDRPYGVIHRVAVDPSYKGRGLAALLIEEAVRQSRELGVKSLRIDTHRDNQSMRRMLSKNGFVYCGVITLSKDGTKRVAYQKDWEV